MNWVAKAALQKALSWCPGSEQLNYLFQHRVTKKYPRSDELLVHWTKIATQHFDIFVKFARPDDLATVAFYEFGTGWDLIIPLTYHALGVRRQTLVDIDPHLRLGLVNDAVRRFNALKPRIEESAGRALRSLDPAPITNVTHLQERFGITYLAPVDARNSHLPSESFDFISSTATLEHVPEPDIVKILAECWRILRPGGFISCRVDMVDHFVYFDPRISEYNFLKFSDATWRLLTSSLCFTNRLRHSDYLRIMNAAGFQIVADEPHGPEPADLDVLRRMRLSARFRHRYTLEDLGTKRMNAVLTKAGEPRAVIPKVGSALSLHVDETTGILEV